jgi:2-dehydropantoate 2-reductase
MFATPELAGSVVPSWDLWTRQLDKLLINAIINPITAILRCKNGVLFEHASGPVHELMLALTFEIWLVYQRLIHRRAFHKLRTEYAGQIPLEERFEFDRMWAFLHKVGAQVKENTSSMLQHVLLGKSTEIREFNGWVVEMASLVGFAEKDVACNRKLIELVESGNVLTQEELSDELDLGAAKDRMWNTLGEKANFLLTGRYKRVSPAETPDQEHGVN